MNRKVHDRQPGTLTFAEDTSARPKITRPIQNGGLGFDYKWDLGWVHDTIHEYLRVEAHYRPQAHAKLIFRMHYAFNENYLLPLSHDDSKPSTKSLIARMPGDDWQKRAQPPPALRLHVRSARQETHVHGR